MSASQAGALTAVTFQLVGALERYESDFDALVATWLDQELYRTVSADMDEIQRYCLSLPGLSAAAVALLISHSGLIDRLWGHPPPGTIQRCLAEHLDQHRIHVEDLRAACLRRLLRSCR